MSPSCSVLLFGHDEILLYTRREVLRHAGFNVLTACTLEDLEIIASSHRIGLLVICSSVRLPDRAKASKIAKGLNPETRSMSLPEISSSSLNVNHSLTTNTFLASVQSALNWTSR